MNNIFDAEVSTAVTFYRCEENENLPFLDVEVDGVLLEENHEEDKADGADEAFLVAFRSKGKKTVYMGIADFIAEYNGDVIEWHWDVSRLAPVLAGKSPDSVEIVAWANLPVDIFREEKEAV